MTPDQVSYVIAILSAIIAYLWARRAFRYKPCLAEVDWSTTRSIPLHPPRKPAMALREGMVFIISCSVGSIIYFLFHPIPGVFKIPILSLIFWLVWYGINGRSELRRQRELVKTGLLTFGEITRAYFGNRVSPGLLTAEYEVNGVKYKVLSDRYFTYCPIQVGHLVTVLYAPNDPDEAIIYELSTYRSKK